MSPKGNQHEVVKSALVDLWYRDPGPTIAG